MTEFNLVYNANIADRPVAFILFCSEGSCIPPKRRRLSKILSRITSFFKPLKFLTESRKTYIFFAHIFQNKIFKQNFCKK